MSTDPTRLAHDFDEVRDITVIGAGPVGLSTAFWAGMREASSRIIDSLPELGGQLTTLYPEKWIFDVPGHPRVLAKDLVELQRRQTLEQFDVPVHLETTADSISWEPDPDDAERKIVVLHTDRGELRSRALIVAGGHGAFEPKKLPGFDMTPWEGRGAYYLVGEKREFEGKRVVIIGGGDSACDWVVNLLDTAERVSLVHRREGFRAHEATVKEVMDAHAEGRIDVHVPFQVKEVAGNGAIERVQLFHSEDEEHIVDIECDAVLLQLGFKTALGPLKEWGFDIDKGAIKVDGLFKTSLDRVWACGDITTFDGKLKLIATGYAEAAIAVSQAVHHIRPETKIQPKYSTNTGVPGAVEGQP
jgi:thioredoxin reductase